MKVLFVCTGNVCRSTMAEAITRSIIVNRGGPDIEVDSAGIHGFYASEDPDRRTRRVLEGHSINTLSAARQITPADFDQFDLIIAMDSGHVEELAWMNPDSMDKVHMMMNYHPHEPDSGDVIDPWYEEIEVFEELYNLLYPACQCLIESLEK